MTDEVATIPITPHPLAIYQQAVANGATAETLREIFELTKDYEKHEAAKKYAEAIAAFQLECPMVFKGREVHGSKGLMYSFASYEDIRRVTRPLERKYGITTGFDIKEEGGKLIGTIRIRVGNYFEDKSFVVPVPKGTITNAAQDYGQGLSYLKRYLYCAALDIVITGEDNDGAGLYQKISREQADKINELISRCADSGNHVNMPKFLDWLQIEFLDQMPADKYDAVVADLQRKMKGKK